MIFSKGFGLMHNRHQLNESAVGGRFEKEVGNWRVSRSLQGNIDLTNMRSLKNALHAFKNKGVGDNKFYLDYNNASVKTDNMELGDLYRFIISKFPKDKIPLEVWNEFVKMIEG